MINLKQVTLVIRIEHEIEAEHLKAHIIRDVPWLTAPILVLQVRLPRNHGLYNNVFNVRPELMRFQAHIL